MENTGMHHGEYMTHEEHVAFHKMQRKAAYKHMLLISGHVLLIVAACSMSFGSVFIPALTGVVNSICVLTGCYAIWYARREEKKEHA